MIPPPLEDAAVSEKTTMARVYQRHAMLSERSAELSSNRGQEKILGVAFDDDDLACEEKVRLSSGEGRRNRPPLVWSVSKLVGRFDVLRPS